MKSEKQTKKTKTRLPSYFLRFTYFNEENRLVSTDVAVDAAVLEVVVDAVPEDFDPNSLPIAEEALEAAALAAAAVADLVMASASRLARDPSALSTDPVLLCVTRLLDPEMSPLMKSAGVVDAVDLLVNPFTLVTRLTMLVRFVVLVRSSLPVDLYWLKSARSALPTAMPFCNVRTEISGAAETEVSSEDDIDEPVCSDADTIPAERNKAVMAARIRNVFIV